MISLLLFGMTLTYMGDITLKANAPYDPSAARKQSEAGEDWRGSTLMRRLVGIDLECEMRCRQKPSSQRYRPLARAPYQNTNSSLYPTQPLRLL